MISFEHPYLLLLLLLLPVLAYLRSRGGMGATLRFSSIAIARRILRKNTQGMGHIVPRLRYLTLACLFVALAGPKVGKSLIERKASGVDIVLAVDVSSSMLALDFTENKNHLVTRLDLAKKILADFIQKRPNDRIGLVAFAGNPYLVTPLTLNHDYLLSNLERLRIGLIEDGTAIGSAIAMCSNRLRDLPSKSRLIVLLTDGVNNMGVDPVISAEAAAQFNIKVYTIAMGNDGPIPSLHLNSKGQIAANVWGKPDIAMQNNVLDTEMLIQIAKKTQAYAYRAKNRQQLTEIYQEIDQLEKTDAKLREYVQYKDVYLYPATLALCFLLLELILANTFFRKLP